MLTPRLAAFLMGFIALETSICALLIADSSPPLRHTEARIFSSLFSTAHGKANYAVDANLSEARVQYARPFVPGKPLPYLRVEVDNARMPMDEAGNPNDNFLFENYPLSPLDWSIILTNGNQAGYKSLAISQPLEWLGASSTELLVLNTRIKDFERSVLVVDLGRGPDLGDVPPELPRYLARHAIPVAQVKGSAKKFEIVNKVSTPPSATGGEETIFAFRGIESSDEPHERHAFALWGDMLIPSLPVALAMLRHEAEATDVRVVMGSHVQVGMGPVIPIDKDGRLELEPSTTDNEHTEAVIAETLIEPEDIPLVADAATKGVLLMAPDTKRPDVPWGEPTELQAIVDTIDTLPQPGPAVAHPRLPEWGETLFFGSLALVLALFLRLRPLARIAAHAGSLLVALLVLFLLLRSTSTWIPVLPLVITSLVGLGLSFAMRRYAVAPQPKAPREITPPAAQSQPASS